MNMHVVRRADMIVQHLLTNGFVHFQSFDAHSAVSAHRAFASLVARWGTDTLSQFTFEREKRPDGHYEPDDGFIDRTQGQGKKDLKRAFHYQPEVAELIRAQPLYQQERELAQDIDRLLDVCEILYAEHMSIAVHLMRSIDATGVLQCSCSEALRAGLESPAPTSRSMLRLLDYPAGNGGAMAKVHFDRSFLTLHSGDAGGVLYARFPDGREAEISPRPGDMLAFWGIKAERLTQGEVTPLRALAHGARAAPWTARQAVVSFWHVNDVLWDAPKVPY